MRNRCRATSRVGGVEGNPHDSHPIGRGRFPGTSHSRSGRFLECRVRAAWQPIPLRRNRPQLQNDLGRRSPCVESNDALSPSLVNSMREANGDVIIVLSDDAGFNPFAFPSPALRKVLVAIPSLRKYPFWPAAARNVVAHELGHALGLDHNDDATSLMCGGTARCHSDFPMLDSLRSQARTRQSCSKCIRRIGSRTRPGGGRRIHRPAQSADRSRSANANGTSQVLNRLKAETQQLARGRP